MGIRNRKNNLDDNVKRMTYIVNTNQGSPKVFFDGIYVGTATNGYLSTKYKVKSSISVTLSGTSIPSSSYSDSDSYSDYCVVTNNTTGSSGTATSGGKAGIDVSYNNSVNFAPKRSTIRTRTTTSYQSNTSGTMTSTSITLNYTKSTSTDTWTASTSSCSSISPSSYTQCGLSSNNGSSINVLAYSSYGISVDFSCQFSSGSSSMTIHN